MLKLITLKDKASELTPEEQALQIFRAIRNILRVPFTKDLRDTNGQFPPYRRWTLPNPEEKALEDIPGPCDEPQSLAGQTSTGSSKPQFQKTQGNETSTKEDSEGISSKQKGGK